MRSSFKPKTPTKDKNRRVSFHRLVQQRAERDKKKLESSPDLSTKSAGTTASGKQLKDMDLQKIHSQIQSLLEKREKLENIIYESTTKQTTEDQKSLVKKEKDLLEKKNRKLISMVTPKSLEQQFITDKENILKAGEGQKTKLQEDCDLAKIKVDNDCNAKIQAAKELKDRLMPKATSRVEKVEISIQQELDEFKEDLDKNLVDSVPEGVLDDLQAVNNNLCKFWLSLAECHGLDVERMDGPGWAFSDFLPSTCPEMSGEAPLNAGDRKRLKDQYLYHTMWMPDFSLCDSKESIFELVGFSKLSEVADWPYDKCMHLISTMQGPEVPLKEGGVEYPFSYKHSPRFHKILNDIPSLLGDGKLSDGTDNPNQHCLLPHFYYFCGAEDFFGAGSPRHMKPADGVSCLHAQLALIVGAELDMDLFHFYEK